MDEDRVDNRSPLKPVNTGETLPLKPWNEALGSKTPVPTLVCTPSKTPWKLSGNPQRTPISKAVPKVQTPSWATRRVVAGTTPAKRPVQLSTRFFELPNKDVLRATSLSMLPNATQAEFWLRKAHKLQEGGHLQEAIDILREALRRDVRPVTEISRAIQQLERDARSSSKSCADCQHAPVSTPHKTSLGEECQTVRPAISGDATLLPAEQQNATPAQPVCTDIPQQGLCEQPQGNGQESSDDGAESAHRRKLQADPSDARLHNEDRVLGTVNTTQGEVLTPQARTRMGSASPTGKGPAEIAAALSNLHTNDLFDTSPGPGAAVGGVYTPLSTRPSATGRQTAAITPGLNGTPERQRLLKEVDAASEAELRQPLIETATLSGTVVGQQVDPALAKIQDVPCTPKSVIRCRAASSLLSPARVKPSARPRIGRKELKSLLGEDYQADGCGGKDMGSIATLSPMRTPARLRNTLGASEVVVTPVRRSARKSVAPNPPPSHLLRRSGYSFVPNAALEARYGKDVVLGADEEFKNHTEVESLAVPAMQALSLDGTSTPDCDRGSKNDGSRVSRG